MRENDYTGSPILDEDELANIEDVGLYEFVLEDEPSLLENEDEMVLHVGATANGAKSLEEVARRLHDFADELSDMSNEGWEIVDDIINGHGTAVRFGAEDDEESL
jgi:hypothetical protein